MNKTKATYATPGALPCPFCGSAEVHGSEHDGVFPYVICERCGASTGYARDRDEALLNWNRRERQEEGR